MRCLCRLGGSRGRSSIEIFVKQAGGRAWELSVRVDNAGDGFAPFARFDAVDDQTSDCQIAFIGSAVGFHREAGGEQINVALGGGDHVG